MDYDCNYHALENLFADSGKWAPVQKPRSEGRAMYQGMIAGLEGFAHEVRGLCRCHNCGTYFFLTSGYNTCYCNNIAPGERERTYRKVGAHREEARG